MERVRGPVAAEEPGDGGPGQRPARSERLEEDVREGHAEAPAEDPAVATLRVVPERERGPQVGDADRRGAIQDSLERRQPEDLGLGLLLGSLL